MKILLATDGSRPALRAAKLAIKLVAQSLAGGSITLINVHDDIGLRHAMQFVGRDVVDDYLRELSDHEIRPVHRLLEKSGLRHDLVMRIGPVAQEIVACADRGKYDFVVLGAKGRGAIADLLLGSVAQRVLATARTPVLLVK